MTLDKVAVYFINTKQSIINFSFQYIYIPPPLLKMAPKGEPKRRVKLSNPRGNTGKIFNNIYIYIYIYIYIICICIYICEYVCVYRNFMGALQAAALNRLQYNLAKNLFLM